MNILIVINEFPPYFTGGSVIRTIKYLKFIQNENLEISILTAERQNRIKKNTFSEIISKYEIFYIKDDLKSFFDLFLKETGTPITSNSKKEKKKSWLFNYIKRITKTSVENLAFPDASLFWIKRGYKKALSLHKTKHFDLIYSTFPEPSSHLLGYKIAKKIGIPLILDYRDLWSTNPIFIKSFALMNKKQINLEKRIIQYASKVIFCTPKARGKYIESGYIKLDKTELIWNGYDPTDFDVPQAEKFFTSGINITYTGTLGSLFEKKRGPLSFFKAFSEVSPSYEQVNLNFFGNYASDVLEYISQHPNIIYHGNVEQTKIANILCSSDILLVILTPEEDLSAVPGKLYEYMASKKFILALTKDTSQVAHLIKDYNFGLVCDPFDETQIRDSLARILKEGLFSKKGLVNEDFVFSFSRKKSSELLVNIVTKFNK